MGPGSRCRAKSWRRTEVAWASTQRTAVARSSGSSWRQLRRRRSNFLNFPAPAWRLGYQSYEPHSYCIRHRLLLVVPVAAAKPKAPVSSFVDPTFGKVLSRIDKQVLYYWQVEKKAGGKVRCVSSCAKAWPPLIVRSAKLVPKKITGLSGVFGTVRRPDGRLQVTRNKLPVYTYAHERPRQVLCDNVDGWFVIRSSVPFTS